MKPIVLLALVLLVSLPCLAEASISLTVYNQDLALVRDTRSIEYKKGADEVLFRDVSARIDATSVHFQSAGVQLLEQNFDYDLVSADKLLQKYIDKQLEVISKDGTVTTGKLLSSGGGVAGGQLVLQQNDGSIRSILLENATEIRYPNLPEGLITRPTLRWLVRADNAGSKETEVAYLTGGLSWRADYVLVLNEKNTQADVAGWVTLTNTSGASYKDAKLKLIAGEVNRVQERPTFERMAKYDMLAAQGAAPQFEEQAFFEYHLYTLQRATSVLDQQTKQVSLFPNTMTTTKKIFEFDPQRKANRVGVSIEFENREASGLGMPLPAGRVRLYQRGPDQSQEFIGEDNIQHTPKNEKVRVRVGEAFDIAVERKQMDVRRISPHVSETDFEVKLRNHKEIDVEIIVIDNFYGDWEITRSSLEYTKISATRVEFKVAAKSEQEVTVTYTVRNR
jgi:hypothetical protein